MFFLLLESIFIYGNLDNDTNILVYTSTYFMNIIKQSHLFNDEKIKFEINDTYDDIDKACKARLDLFMLPSIINYNKILYLDIDILVKDSINKVFYVCNEDILYVLEEGQIDDSSDCWGKSLFGNEINNYDCKTAFTSGILLFNNCEKIKKLFSIINECIIKKNHFFHDQPYIIYNAFKYNLYDNKILKSLVVNNDYNIDSDKVIHHFPGGQGNYKDKIEKMYIFLNSVKDYKNKINDVPSPNGIVKNVNEGIICRINEYVKNYLEIHKSIIISRYNEDLEWINEYPFNQFQYIVYNKGVNENFCKNNVKQIINLPNVGRESHTYLYHIVNNYDNLSDILIFFPGSLNLNYKKEKAIKILNNIILNNYKKAIFVGHYQNDIFETFKDFKLDNWKCSNLQNLELNPESELQLSRLRPYGKWYRYFFRNIKARWNTYWGTFSIDKRDIIQHPKTRYKILLNTISNSSNPEANHYMERSWGAVFYPMIYTKKII
jgi:lipopolysaccharide biosynthesis glycosyltransferase